MTSIVVLFSWVYTYLQTCQAVCIKRMQVFVRQSYLTKSIFNKNDRVVKINVSTQLVFNR